jgi:MFS family permease
MSVEATSDLRTHAEAAEAEIVTDIPARLDRLPWCRFHVLVVIALGITWILDGIEVTIVGALGPTLGDPATLGLSPTEIGSAASAYLVGAVSGALLFGWLSDRFGRRSVFYITLAIYLGGVLLTSASWSFASFAIFRGITGLGIGGEYAAINSAIDELIPARLRGRTDIIINGSFWLGAAAGSGASLVLLNTRWFGIDWGWRAAFLLGAAIGFVILLLRRFVPESPRWLATHGYEHQAEATVAEIERRVVEETGAPLAATTKTLKLRPRRNFGFDVVVGTVATKFRARAALALTLMVAQAFLYNAVFFSYGIVLSLFYDVPAQSVGTYMAVLAVSNLFGPLLLGPLFDTVGRRVMITATYGISGCLLAIVSAAFALQLFTAWTQTLGWVLIFFFASAGASSAYLTASELFPLEIRALAIAVFYSVGTAVGGIAAPALFGLLLSYRTPWPLARGYLFAAMLLLAAASVEWFIGIDAERKSLEELTDPLSLA